MNEIDPKELSKRLSKLFKIIGVKCHVRLNDSRNIVFVSLDLLEAHNLASWLKLLLEWRRKRSPTIAKLLGDKSQPKN